MTERKKRCMMQDSSVWVDLSQKQVATSRLRPFLFVCGLALVVVLVLNVPRLHAASMDALVRKGNAAYAQGDYEEALSLFEEAGVEAPESAHLYFNKGAVYYRLGDFAKSKEAYENAALKSKDLSLEAKSKYNLGNCWYREAERERDSDLQKSLTACEQSIRQYQAALALEPEYVSAAENIEVVRLVMKAILDEIKKQEQQAKEQQQKREAALKQLQEMVQKQEALLNENQKLAQKQSGSSSADKQRLRQETLAQDQEALREETDRFSEQLSSSTPDTPSPIEEVKKELAHASQEEQQAVERLEEQKSRDAIPHQEQALDHLNRALAALQGEGGQQKPPSSEEGKKEQASKGNSSPQASDPPKEEPSEQEMQEALAQLSDEAKDILEEEKEHRQRRQQQAAGRYRPVDRDW